MGKSALVTGAGGFIGGHLVKRLLNDGYAVYAVDIKPRTEWWQLHSGADNSGVFDLRDIDSCMLFMGGEPFD